MSNFNSLDLFINHITPADNELLKQAVNDGIQDENLESRMMVEEGNIGWDVYVGTGEVGDNLWQAKNDDLKELLADYGFSDLFINIAVASRLDGYDMVRLSKDLSIDERFPLSDTPVIENAKAYPKTGDKKKGQLASVVVMPGEESEETDAAVMRLVRVSPDMLSLEFDTPDGPTEIGVEMVNGKVKPVVFSPQNKEEMSQLFDATITIGNQGTLVMDQQGKETLYQSEDRAPGSAPKL